MLPKLLRIQAFGPYVEEQVIDFQQFQHLFLIRGETGSGKTMILDAMTYALYGKSSGGQREDLESMRSRFASEDVFTIVEFTFRLKDHEYRFTRKVETRIKRNKERAVKVSVDAGEIIDTVYTPFFENPKLRSIEEKAISLIGLTYDQFIQVMVLPQGKFEQFLVSSSEEKQSILRTLFRTERFESYIDGISDRMNQMRKELEESKFTLEALWKSVDVASFDDVIQQIEHYQKQQEEILQKLSMKETEVKKLQERFQQQERYHDLKTQYEQVCEEEKSLLDHDSKIKHEQAMIEEYEQVERIVPYYQHYMQRVFEVEERAKEEQVLEQQVLVLHSRAETMKEWHKACDTARLVVIEAQTEQMLLQSIYELNKHLEQLQTEQHQLENTMREKQVAHTQALLAYHSASQEHEQYYQTYLDNSAIALQETLLEGEACPVCGSITHPGIYHQDQKDCDVFTLKAKKDQMDMCKQRVDDLHYDYMKTQTSYSVIQKQYDDCYQQYLTLKDKYQTSEDTSGYWEALLHKNKQKQEENMAFIETKEAVIQQFVEDQKEQEQLLLKAKEETKRSHDNLEEAKKAFEEVNEKQVSCEQLAKQPSRELMVQYKEEVSQFMIQKVRLETRKQELKQQLDGKQEKSLSLIKSLLQEEETAYKALQTEMAHNKERERLFEHVAKKAQALLSAYEAKQPIFQKLVGFTKALRGDNSIGIERYVLGIMLSNITQLANQLLSNVHQGRYQLYRSEHATNKTRKFGLEFRIYDTYSCAMRSVVSLSGGEKFLVSLALSLALSNSVQARNGGIRFDCMFIDEGFGTLDEQSIQDALTILEAMGRQKAMIGMISHVDLLKEQIHSGLEIRKTRNGSTICLREE